MKVAALLFDLEGTLLQAKTHEVLPGAREMLNFCRKQNLPFRIISNNTIETPEKLLGILSERDLRVESDQLLTPLKILTAEVASASTALVIGSANLQTFVEGCGLKVQQAADVDIVICGGSYTITNDILHAATSALLKKRARFVCLHRNRIFNDADGVARPDVGCIVVGLEYSTGVPAKTLGKPSSEYFREAVHDWHVDPEKTLLISDDPISDLGGGKAFGFQTGFVHTGKYGADAVSGLNPRPDKSWATLEVALVELSNSR